MAKIEQKQVVVNEIIDKLKGAKSAVLVDPRGLTVEQDTILRKKLREAGIFYKVYKNKMMNLAVEGTEFQNLREYFAGPNAIAISYDDATLAASIINKEIKAMPKLQFRAGLIEGVVYDAAGVIKIAGIPSKGELISKLLGSLKSPISSFARVIKAIADKDASPAAEEAPAVEAPVVEEAPVAEEAPVTEETAE